MNPISQEELERLADLLPTADEEPTNGRATNGATPAFDIDGFVRRHLADRVVRESPWGAGGYKWVLSPCPWDPLHTDNSAYVLRLSSGAVVARCHHNGCAGREWKDLRAHFESAEKNQPAAPQPTQPSHAASHGLPRESAGAPRRFSGAGRELTDTGNAERLADLHGENLRYIADARRWLVWDGRRFGQDRTKAIMRYAVDTVRSIYAEADASESPDHRQALAKHALRSESSRQLEALVSSAQSHPSIAIEPGALDRDPWLFCCANGTLDLRTGTLREHARPDLASKLSPVRYEPEAPHPRWDAFLDRVLAGDAALKAFLQKAVGYSMTGDTREQAIFYLYGSGANGKSLFLSVIEHILGDYAQPIRPDTLMIKAHSDSGNDIAALMGARFVPTIEIQDGSRLAEGLVKQMTGGDRLTARFLYGEYFSFRPQFKIWLAVNHKPKIAGADEGIWRRVRLVPFRVSIPEEQQDRELEQKLKRESPGILNWLVRGCLAWQKEGLRAPPAVTEATQEYRSEMDVLAQFLAERCDTEDPKAVEPSSALYEAYSQWCESSGERKWSKQRFGRGLTEKGFEQERAGQVRAWQGVRVVP